MPDPHALSDMPPGMVSNSIVDPQRAKCLSEVPQHGPAPWLVFIGSFTLPVPIAKWQADYAFKPLPQIYWIPPDSFADPSAELVPPPTPPPIDPSTEEEAAQP
jgi:hypothetical protein